MREIFGDLWAYDGREGFRICITTNGFIKQDGTGVMGRGTAQQAAGRYPELPKLLGKSLVDHGLVVHMLTPQIISFPVKYNWYEDADIGLIEQSTKELARRAKKSPQIKFILPRPGCGNGNLAWPLVRKTLMKYFANLDNVWVIAKWEEKDGNAQEVHGKEAGKGRKPKHAGHDAGVAGKRVRPHGAEDLRAG